MLKQIRGKDMSAKENLANAFGTLICGVIAFVCATFIPFEIINAENHTIITEIGDFRFIGPIFNFLAKFHSAYPEKHTYLNHICRSS
jgi:predicted permease